MIEITINIILFLMLVVTALAIIRMDKLFAVVMLSGVFSFLSPCVLPIVPGFISYIVGKSFSDLKNNSKKDNLKFMSAIKNIFNK